MLSPISLLWRLPRVTEDPLAATASGRLLGSSLQGKGGAPRVDTRVLGDRCAPAPGVIQTRDNTLRRCVGFNGLDMTRVRSSN